MAISDTCQFGLTRREREEMQGKVRMLELTIYGLMGLAKMLVIAFYFAYAGEFSPAREQSSLDLVNNARLSESSAMKNGTLTPAFSRGQVEVLHG